MIVADTNLVAYLLLGGPGTDAAREVFLRDSDWAAPILWRSEFRNILAGHMRRGHLTAKDALAVQCQAEELLSGREHLIASADILRLVGASNCSAYDCEFVALALQLRTSLVTSDKRVLKNFPDVATTPKLFTGGSA